METEKKKLNNNPQFLNIVETFHIDGMGKERQRTDGHSNSVTKFTCLNCVKNELLSFIVAVKKKSLK
jgi:hypothetical protein